MKIADSLKFYSNLLLFRLQNGSPRQYEKQWDSYWRTIRTTGAGGEVLWDNLPEKASAEDLERFQQAMDPGLPLIDLGCGNGRQSRYLARHFQRVIGVDVAPAAIDLARREAAGSPLPGNLTFRTFNGANPGEAEVLHDEIGDANIYMRTVLHCVQQEDRPRFVEGLRTLLGERGVLYQIELSRGALETLRTFPGDSPSGLPQLVHNVVRHGVHPIGFTAKDRETFYPEDRWTTLGHGDGVKIKTVLRIEGEDGLVPASYLLLKPRQPQAEPAAAAPQAAQPGHAA